MFTNNQNKYSKLTYFLSVLLLASCTLSLSMTSGGNIEAKFKKLDLSDGSLSDMNTRFADGKFEVVSVAEEINDTHLHVIYLAWTPKPRKINLVFTNGNDQDTVLQGDGVYVYDRNSTVPEFTLPMRVPIYASVDDKSDQLDAAGNYATRRMGVVSSLISGDKNFAKKFKFIKFNRIVLQPWDYPINMKDAIEIFQSNQAVLAQMPELKEKFYVPPEGTQISGDKEVFERGLNNSVEELKEFYTLHFNAQTENDNKVLPAMLSLFDIHKNKILKYVKEKMNDFWASIDDTKAVLQSVYYKELIEGPTNLIFFNLLSSRTSSLNQSHRMIDMINGDIRQNLIADKSNDSAFPMLDSLRQVVAQSLSEVLKTHESACYEKTTGEDTSNKRAYYHGMKSKIELIFNSAIGKMKFILVQLSYNQIEAAYPAAVQYAQLTQQMYPDFPILDSQDNTKVDLRGLGVAFYKSDWENPNKFTFSKAQPPFLVSARRNLVLV